MLKSIIHVSDESLEQDVFKSTAPVLLDLWAPWCAPCKALAPVLEKLSAEYEGRLQVAKVDVEKYPGVQQQFGVRGIPTLILFRDGTEVSRVVGSKSREELRRWLERSGVDAKAREEGEAEVEPPRWGAFYGDAGLRDFLSGRLSSRVAAGSVIYGRTPFWEEGRGTLAAAFMASTDLAVFSAVTGMPQSFACALEFVSPIKVDVASVEALLNAIPADADLSDLAPRLMRAFLCDERIGWSRIMGDARLDALLLEWTGLCDRTLAGQKIARTEWTALTNALAALESKEPSANRDVQDAFLAILSALSPVPAREDGSSWVGAMLMIGKYLQMVLAQDRLGWTAEDYALEGFREAWFVAREKLEPTGIFTEETLGVARDAWMSEHGDRQRRHGGFLDDFELNIEPVVAQVQALYFEVIARVPVFAQGSN